MSSPTLFCWTLYRVPDDSFVESWCSATHGVARVFSSKEEAEAHFRVWWREDPFAPLEWVSEECAEALVRTGESKGYFASLTLHIHAVSA